MSDASLKQTIQEDMKSAMRAKDTARLGVIRLILAAMKQKEVDERVELDDTQVLAIIDKMIKQRQESIRQYQAANRTDLADQESFEISILQVYLPPQLSEADIQALVQAAIEKTGATDIKDMGKVMAEVRPQAQGRADMGVVSGLIKQKLG